MIKDTLSNAKLYKGIKDGIDKILEAAKQYTPENYPGGRIELDGKRIFMSLAKYNTLPTDDAVFEAHKKYIDVMIMVDGVETIYVKNTDSLSKITRPYNPDDDALLAHFDKDATPVRLEAGSFVVLFPQDAHSPSRHADGEHSVKKIIGKVLIED